MVTIESPTYLFRFVDDQNKTEYFIELTNTTPANNRIDIFSLILPTDLDLESGLHLMQVYQSDDPGNEDYTLFGDPIYEGHATVTAEFTSNSTYEPTGTDTTYQG